MTVEAGQVSSVEVTFRETSDLVQVSSIINTSRIILDRLLYIGTVWYVVLFPSHTFTAESIRGHSLGLRLPRS